MSKAVAARSLVPADKRHYRGPDELETTITRPECA